MKKINVVIIFSIMILFSVASVHAISISINPASLIDNSMVKGGYTEKMVRVSTNEASATVRAYFDNESKKIVDWIRLDPEDKIFNLSKDNPRNIRVIVEPPADTPNGNYGVNLIFSIRNNDVTTGFTGAVIDTAVAYKISISIVDEEVLSCNVRSMGLSDVEAGNDWRSVFSVLNSGNVRITPTIIMDIWDQEKTELVKSITFNKEEILPRTTESVEVLYPTDDFDPGQYFVDVQIPECFFKESGTFDILEPGTISDEGKLIGIRVQAWNNLTETIEIAPIFKNLGTRDVTAKFKGSIKLNGEIKKVIETETITVAAKQQTEFLQFFTPTEPGRYEVSGRVYYGTKQTFEKVNRFNVLNEISPKKSSNGMTMFIWIGIIGFILLILIKQKKTKQKQHRHYKHH